MRSRQRARIGAGRKTGRDMAEQASAASRRKVSADNPGPAAAQRNPTRSDGPIAGSTSTSKGSLLVSASSRPRASSSCGEAR